MSLIDYVVLIGTMLGIVGYGMWHTRGKRDLRTYLKGDQSTSWVTIGLSVMATQASAITFLSTPGQGYADGMKFVQIYFGLPIAMVIIAVFFLPLYRGLNVYTAYEFLGKRFDRKTRLAGATLFMLQRGLGAGLTIYAPAIVISTVLGWSLDLTILVSGLLVIIYTASGGSEAVNVTQKHQMILIFFGLIVAFGVLVAKMPDGLGFGEALRVAGNAGRLQAIDTSPDPNNRYTIWTGIFGGLFLSLAYFGTDQSQVQRYLSGGSLRQSRLGLLFNAIFKIPMQAFILLLGTLVFVFYQFEQPPLYFNQAQWRTHAAGPSGDTFRSLEERFTPVHAERAQHLKAWLAAEDAGDATAAAAARAAALENDAEARALRAEAIRTLNQVAPGAKTTDTDYVFITFVLDHLPHGIIGLLVAVIFAGGLSSISSELNALGTTTTVDFYRHVIRPNESDGHYVVASKAFTAMWGVIAVAFAFFFQLADNLIQAVNLIGSLFYGPVLGLFIVAFFFKSIRGSAAFWAALAAQAIVIVVHNIGGVAFLWYNPIGCGSVVLLGLIFQALAGGRSSPSGTHAA